VARPGGPTAGRVMRRSNGGRRRARHRGRRGGRHSTGSRFHRAPSCVAKEIRAHGAQHALFGRDFAEARPTCGARRSDHNVGRAERHDVHKTAPRPTPIMPEAPRDFCGARGMRGLEGDCASSSSRTRASFLAVEPWFPRAVDERPVLGRHPAPRGRPANTAKENGENGENRKSSGRLREVSPRHGGIGLHRKRHSRYPARARRGSGGGSH